jgi:copper ion binding protein
MGEALETATLRVRGITCVDCVSRIATGLRRLPGVAKVTGNLERGSVKVVFDPGKVPVAEIVRAVEDTGYRVEGVEA